jgi:hypothetical protein
LSELTQREKEQLVDEAEGWEGSEARFKGRDLWITSVKAGCSGGEGFRDDVTVWGEE